ncbi:MAG: DNA-directed RNA polymerase subunit beta [Bacteroidales bacterium]|nr:DNA-directed RNA polymerase subunit beta [Bacteroidales bacterium]
MDKSLERISFASVKKPFDYPDLLDIQLKSFKDFFQLETSPEKRSDEGLRKVFKEYFPVVDSRSNYQLDFIDYYIDAPQYSIQECIERGLSYCVRLKTKLKLSCIEKDRDDFETKVQDVYLGNIPYMTPRGTFVINGAERVVVSQLHRSPGVFFGSSTHANGSTLYSARIIPFKGSWMEFSTDISNTMFAYIDRKKKLPVTTLLRAIGYETDKDILDLFNLAVEVKVSKKDRNALKGRRLAAKVLLPYTVDMTDEETGEFSTIDRLDTLCERDIELTDDKIDLLLEKGIKSVLVQNTDIKISDYSLIFNTLSKDGTNSEREAVEFIYKLMKSSDAPDYESAHKYVSELFLTDKNYSLGEVGRYRVNKKLNLDIPEDIVCLTKEDITSIIKYLITLSNGKAEVDDIDHLSNRRIRTVGEQLYAQFGLGLKRMQRTIKERMNTHNENDSFTPTDLVNAKTLSSVINSFFGTNQLSQFMDQTNPLSEITHKRRISALGPGGLSRDRAGFEVRDVHYTHYGRLCTIETPEGPNIGLISSLSVFAKVNKLGFISTPYRKVNEGVVDFKNAPNYLTAEEEEGMNIAQSCSAMTDDGKLTDELIKVRCIADYPIVTPENIDYIDVAPNQISSVAASLIPFLEHDDANRALMGSNMMRQAVPLMNPEAPIVGTGMERYVARDSRVLIEAEGNGTVVFVDSTKIVIDYDWTEDEKIVNFDDKVKTYELIKFARTNQSTVMNQKPIVKKGDKVVKGQIITEGYATADGDLALGRNLMVAFMPWKGYNYEDAIVISERIVKEDIFTSIHVDEFTLEVRDTKRGIEQLTNDIPNVSAEATKELDENGLIRVGAEVREGDILIGKITPKGETDPTPEEKLLRAIFGEKAGDVKNASLKAGPSMKGFVIGKRLFSRAVKDRKAKAKDKERMVEIDRECNLKLDEVKNLLVDKLMVILSGHTSAGVQNRYGETVVVKRVKFAQKLLKDIDYQNINSYGWTSDAHTNDLVVSVIDNYNLKIKEIIGHYSRIKNVESVGDELPNGIVQMAKVYVAQKRKLNIGDKMAGRHGNKGIVSRIVREEDMPFLADGTPVDIVLNPLGVPSRMNLGQIYETVLGWAGKKLGKKFATPIFDGASLDDINNLMKEAGLPANGRIQLYDGGTGEPFDQEATVGYIYMLKLHHMVDDKMHARSIGPYSLITQQPLGGKAQFGGQRFGEMEVWALEAFGASNVLQEILTVKSDDVVGRAKAYEAIVKGDNMPKPGIPESFNVLVHELRGLGLEVTFE